MGIKEDIQHLVDHTKNDSDSSGEQERVDDWLHSPSCSLKDADFKPLLKLVGADGNAFVVLGRAQRVAEKNNMDWKKIQKEATSGNYDHLLQTMMKYFEVE